jgi:hypothetical protein
MCIMLMYCKSYLEPVPSWCWKLRESVAVVWGVCCDAVEQSVVVVWVVCCDAVEESAGWRDLAVGDSCKSMIGIFNVFT